MNILLSVKNMGLGGVTTYVAHLASGLAERHKVIIYDHYPYASDYDAVAFLPKEVIIENVSQHSFIDRLNWMISSLLKRFRVKTEFWDYWNTWYFKKMLKKFDIQLITSFDKFSDKIVVDAIGSSLPLVLSVHGSYDISEYYRLPEEEIRFYEPVFRTARAIVYKTDCNIRILEYYPGLDNIKVVKRIFHGFKGEVPRYDPLFIRARLDIPPSAFVFGMIARGIAEKGWKEAVLAFLQVKKETDRELHFMAIGGSQYLDNLQREFEAEESIHFTGFVEHPMDYVNALDVGVLPTYAPTENFTFSVVEYMFCHKPSIASDHGEISLALEADGQKAGILIPNIQGRPDVQGFIQAMKVYLEDEKLYNKHKALTIKALEKFSSQKAVAEYEEVFDALVSPAASQA